MSKYAVLTFLLLITATACSQVYKDREFGFEITIPDKATVCIPEVYQHSTGVLFYLDEGGADCHDKDNRRYIAIVGSYNAEDWPDTATLIENSCMADGASILHYEAMFSMAGLPAKMCRMDLNEKRILIVLAAQHWKKQRVSQDISIPDVNFFIFLQTDSGNFQQDYALLEDVIKRVQITGSVYQD